MLQAGPPVIARPLKSNDRFFPLVNEMVRIVPASSYQNQDPKSNYKISYYYDDIISTWDSPEHNAVPDHTFNDSQFAKRETYQGAQQGVSNISGDKNVSATGLRFKETGRVRKLMHSPGDRTIEGRTGNSIRMGSSNSTMKTPWSGKDNNPLLIIRNGQKITSGDAWLPVFEDIDKDGSSIYMLSGQSMTFIPGNNNFDTYHQRVNTNPKSKYIEPNNDKSSVVDDFNVEKIVDIPPVIYQTSNTNPVTGSSVITDEIDFLPDNENQFFKETEDVILIGDDNPTDRLKSDFSITTYLNTDSSGKTYGKSSDIKQSIATGKYNDLPVISYQQTKISIVDFATYVNALFKSGKFNLSIARSIIAVAINEQGRGEFITGGNYNHYGVQTDGGRWGKGVNNISFVGQYFLKDSVRVRAFAAFADESDGILFMADVLTRKGFSNIQTSIDFAKLYIKSWWGSVSSDLLITSKKSGFDKALKLIV